MRPIFWKLKCQRFIIFHLLNVLIILSTIGANVIRQENITQSTIGSEIITENLVEPTTTVPSSVISNKITTHITRLTAEDIAKKINLSREQNESSDNVQLSIDSTTISNNHTSHVVAVEAGEPLESTVKTTGTAEGTSSIFKRNNVFERTESVKEIHRASTAKDLEETSTETDVGIGGQSKNQGISTTIPFDGSTTTVNNESTSEKSLEKNNVFKTVKHFTTTTKEILDIPTTVTLQPTFHTSSTSHSEGREFFSADATTLQTTKITDVDSHKNESTKSTTEQNFINSRDESKFEGRSYDITTNEIKNSTNHDNYKNLLSKIGDKQVKHVRDPVNMTLPEATDIWTVGSYKNENTTIGQLPPKTIIGNVTTERISKTNVKLLSDWSQLMEAKFNDSIKNNANSIENVLENTQVKQTEDSKNNVDNMEQGNDVVVTQDNIRMSTSPVRLTTVQETQTENANKDESKLFSVNIQTENYQSKSNKTSEVKVEQTNKIIQSTDEIASTTESNAIQRDVVSVFLSETEGPEKQMAKIKLPETTISNRNETITNSMTNTFDETTFIASTRESMTTSGLPNSISRMGATTDVEDSTTESLFNSEGTDLIGIGLWTSEESLVNVTPISTPTSEMATTEDFSEDISEYSTAPVSTMQTQIDSDEESSRITTTEYQSQFSTSSENSNIITSETTRFNSISEDPLENNAIERFLDISTSAGDGFSSEDSKMSTTTFISSPDYFDSTPNEIRPTEEISTTTIFQNTPVTPEQKATNPSKETTIPQLIETTTEMFLHPITTTRPTSQVARDMSHETNNTDYNVIIAISVSVVGIIALILLVGFLYVMRKRQKNLTYGQRCRPVNFDAYSLDNVSIYNSVRRKGAARASKRSYGNVAFDDPSLKHNLLNVQDLGRIVEKKMTIHEEFRDVPQIIARPDEVPQGCEDKNRYANVIPLPETRVILQRQNGDEKTEYINANFVQGPKDPPNYYIACQGPLESTVPDFWRMIWEQNSRVIIMATDLIENGKEKCAEYLPPSMTIDNHVVYGDFQITLKNREVKEKYAVSTLHITNNSTSTWREITHFWYQWPETGVPSDEAGVIAMLLEARSCLKMSTLEQADDEDGKTNGVLSETNGNYDNTKTFLKTQGPLTIHCSNGTGRTGTIIACDIALRSLEAPRRSIDIPQFVYYVRRGRASAISTKEQYEFIYRVANMYATKISAPINET